MVAIEFPAPDSPNSRTVKTLLTRPPTRNTATITGPLNAAPTTTTETASVARLNAVPSQPPSCTQSELTSRHHCPLSMADTSRSPTSSISGTANCRSDGTATAHQSPTPQAVGDGTWS